MKHFMMPIGMAFLIFPLIAILFTLPYIVYQYRKFGSILFVKTAIVYSFILYLLTTYFLVILPLPPIEEVASLTTAKVQLIPFRFVFDFFKDSGFVWNQFSTYFKAITSPSFYNVLFNVFLTLPFAVYLRYYFGFNSFKTIVCTFLLSLFFELTQLSGLYGIYPRPYRLFDVDDLFTNTLGGCIGYLITPLFSFFLPSREEIDKAAFKKGERVSYFRRLCAFCFDLAFALFFTILIPTNWMIGKYIIVIVCYFILIPYLTRGQTIGKWIVKIKIVTEEDKVPTLSNLLVRYGLLYFVLLPAPFYCIYLLSILGYFPPIIIFTLLFLLFILGGSYAVFCFHSFIAIISRKNTLWYESLSKTKHSSTVYIPKQEKIT
ncbi:MAG: VanZ family protein [Bacilli bacterium]|nr:VanZ family protein [Bacilli bacterium]